MSQSSGKKLPVLPQRGGFGWMFQSCQLRKPSSRVAQYRANASADSLDRKLPTFATLGSSKRKSSSIELQLLLNRVVSCVLGEHSVRKFTTFEPIYQHCVNDSYQACTNWLFTNFYPKLRPVCQPWDPSRSSHCMMSMIKSWAVWVPQTLEVWENHQKIMSWRDFPTDYPRPRVPNLLLFNE